MKAIHRIKRTANQKPPGIGACVVSLCGKCIPFRPLSEDSRLITEPPCYKCKTEADKLTDGSITIETLEPGERERSFRPAW